MKTKKIITLLSGVLIGLSIGVLINKNDKEKIEVNTRNIDNEYTVLRVYDNDDYCNICGEKLEEDEADIKNKLANLKSRMNKKLCCCYIYKIQKAHNCQL